MVDNDEDSPLYNYALDPMERHVLQRALKLLMREETTPLEDGAIGRLGDKLDPGWRDRPPRPMPE